MSVQKEGPLKICYTILLKINKNWLVLVYISKRLYIFYFMSKMFKSIVELNDYRNTFIDLDYSI